MNLTKVKAFPPGRAEIMAVAAPRRRKSLKMPSEEKNPSSGNQHKTPSGNAPADLRTFGKYVIEKKLGEGGMGAVYRASDATLKRTVALKILPRDKAKNEILVKRFQAEAQAAAQLRHKNIVCIYDSGELDGYLYIAMEYIDGIDVQDLVLRKGGLSIKRSLDIIKQVARALEHAHEQTIVHRDIKPANLLIDRDGNVKLADMGLARSIAETEEAGITRAGTTVGTVDYMSPEQARDSKSADCRSDMYSLAATWYHMLVGRPLFPKGDLLNKITAHATEAPPDPREDRPNIPESVVQIMHRMLEKKAEKRYQSPTELLHDLENGFSGDSSSASSEGDNVLSFDILAGLAEEDMAADAEIPVRGSKSASRPKRKKQTAQTSEPAASNLPSTATLPKSPVSSTPSSEEIVTTKPRKKRALKKNTGAKSSPEIHKKKVASASDTIADDAETSSTIPSTREAMLARNLRHRHASENRKQMVILGVVVLAVVLIGYMAYSALTGTASPQPAGSTAPASPVTQPATIGTGTASGNNNGPAAPSRQPPRRVE